MSFWNGFEKRAEDLIKEHRRLVRVLRSKNREDDLDEARKQEAELKDLEKKASSSRAIAQKKDPKKWSAAKSRAVSKMGGKWSARAAQLATKYYKDSGGTYSGKKSSSNSLSKWTKQDWRPNPHAKNRPDPSIAKDSSGNTTRYLPKNKWDSLTPSEAAATDKKKRMAKEQWVPNTEKAKVKVASCWEGYKPVKGKKPFTRVLANQKNN